MEFPTALKLSQEYLINSKGNMDKMCTVGRLILKKKRLKMWICPYAGSTETFEDFWMWLVHFKDVALAHILVYENPLASGRHLCIEAISHYGDFVAKVAELYPEYNVPR